MNQTAAHEERDEMNQAPPPSNQAMVLIEQSRAVQEVQAALVIAKRFPRDMVALEMRIITDCKRLGLAKVATYSYPRGGQTVTGPSIRLAEMLARNYGNMAYGYRVLSQNKTESQVEAKCWDQETNTQSTRIFTVQHHMRLKNGTDKMLTDERDIYEKVANYAARRVRATILQMIPGDIVESALSQVRRTLSGDGKKPLIDLVKEMVIGFKSVGVSQEMIEKRMGHAVDICTGDEVVEYCGIFNAIKDKVQKREDWFEFPKTNEPDEARAIMIAKLSGDKPKELAPTSPISPSETDQEIDDNDDQGDFAAFRPTTVKQ